MICPSCKTCPNSNRSYLTTDEIKNVSVLKALTELKHLTLWGTKVEDLSPLQSMPNLQRLSLEYTKVGRVQVDALEKANPELWVRLSR